MGEQIIQAYMTSAGISKEATAAAKKSEAYERAHNAIINAIMEWGRTNKNINSSFICFAAFGAAPKNAPQRTDADDAQRPVADVKEDKKDDKKIERIIEAMNDDKQDKKDRK